MQLTRHRLLLRRLLFLFFACRQIRAESYFVMERKRHFPFIQQRQVCHFVRFSLVNHLPLSDPNFRFCVDSCPSQLYVHVYLADMQKSYNNKARKWATLVIVVCSTRAPRQDRVGLNWTTTDRRLAIVDSTNVTTSI